jgi:hypothetical protein
MPCEGNVKEVFSPSSLIFLRTPKIKDSRDLLCGSLGGLGLFGAKATRDYYDYKVG